MNENIGKIGVGIITCNRASIFEQCIKSIPVVDTLVIVNDGKPYPVTVYPSTVTRVVQHKINRGIAKSKNDALRFLIKNDCEHLFLIEDDVKVNDSLVFKRYIRASLISGICHFNYGYHGPWNKSETGEPLTRYSVDYGEGVNVVFHRFLTGAFSYFRREAVLKAGFMDVIYRNVLEHVDHTYQIIKNGYHPPFHWFADIEGSNNYIGELDENLGNSVIRKKKTNFDMRIRVFNYYFKRKNGYAPGELPDTDERTLIAMLHEIQKRHALPGLLESFDLEDK